MIDESSASFESSTPPPAAAPRKHRGRIVAIVLIAAVLVGGIGVGAWWALDQHSKLGDTQAALATTEGQLETTQQELAGLQQESSQQIAALEEQSASLDGELTRTTDELTALQGEHTQALADKATLESAKADLEAAIEEISGAVAASRELAAAIAVLTTPVNGYRVGELPDDVLALLDELAAAIGWYPTAADYADNLDLAEAHVVSILQDAGDPDLAQDYQTSQHSNSYGDFARWFVRLYLNEIVGLDEAIQTGQAALAD